MSALMTIDSIGGYDLRGEALLEGIELRGHCCRDQFGWRDSGYLSLTSREMNNLCVRQVRVT